MNTRRVGAIFLTVGIALFGWLAVRKLRAESVPPQPRLFRSTNYPPRTAEEKALWEWREAMKKADPIFEWKMPIEFYGKAIDQSGQPVAGARVEASWTTAVGPSPDPKKILLTDSNGQFVVTGIRGKLIVFAVSKPGYNLTPDWIQGFEYGDFSDAQFHVPDSNQPVLFHLHKIVESEPFYKFIASGDIAVGGEPLILNLEKGKAAAQGDLAFSVSLGTGTDIYGNADFVLTVQALNGAGIVLSDDQFLSKAPESGYQTTATVTNKVNEPNYKPEKTFWFYAKTGAGRYGCGEVSVSLRRNLKQARLKAILRYNPSGSRILEFDPAKQINP